MRLHRLGARRHLDLARFWLSKTPRPYVAWAATDLRSARRLYRAQNLIWIWLGLSAALTALVWLLRPSLGPAVTSGSELMDAIRYGLFCYGGLLISAGVWWIRRELEVFGHVMFAVGAVLTAVVAATQPGSTAVATVTTAGVAVASALRGVFLVRWIGAAHGED